MVIRISLSPADHELFQYRANRVNQSLEEYIREIVTCAAADLGVPMRCRVSLEQAWQRNADPAESPADDPEPISGWGLGPASRN